MIAVVGVGAIGGVCAAALAGRGAEPVCCVRTPFDELVVEGPEGRLSARPRVVTRPAEVGPARWVLFATKAHQTAGAAPWLDALVGAETTVAVLQNGVEHVERLRPHARGAAILPVVVDCPAEATSPGRVTQRRAARLVVPAGAAGHAFAALFEGTAVQGIETDDFTSAVWRKLCFNVTSGALAALAGRGLPEIAHPGAGAMALALASEGVAVGRAEGARFAPDLAREIAAGAGARSAGGVPSTLTDRRAGRPLEVDARNGAVVRIGARHGIATPANARAVELMRDLHLGAEDRLPRLWEVVRAL